MSMLALYDVYVVIVKCLMLALYDVYVVLLLRSYIHITTHLVPHSTDLPVILVHIIYIYMIYNSVLIFYNVSTTYILSIFSNVLFWIYISLYKLKFDSIQIKFWRVFWILYTKKIFRNNVQFSSYYKLILISLAHQSTTCSWSAIAPGLCPP